MLGEYTKGHLAHNPTVMDCPEQAVAQKQKADRWWPAAQEGDEEWLLRGLEFLFRQ